MSEKKNFWSGLVSGLLIAALLVGCVYIGNKLVLYQLKQTETVKQEAKSQEKTQTGSVVKNNTIQKMQTIEQVIDEYYLEEAAEEDMENGIYSGMIKALGDPYSVYYTPEDLGRLREQTQGSYYGIGAYVSLDQDLMMAKISGVIENTPAEETGLRTGDLIYKVDDQEVQGKEVTDVVSLIKGQEGTTVKLTLIREGENDYLEFHVERRKIDNVTVYQEMKENNIGYIRIVEFDEITLPQFEEALAACRSAGMKSLILDLRDNPGGNLNTVCDISRMLLPEGLIVYTEDKNGERVEYSCDGSSELGVPLTVLVNGNSASASEILAGAVKDYGIGTIMGTTTFGKGIVQRVLTLTDGSAMKLTVSHYFTPKGNNIHEVGIEPDVTVELDYENYYENGVDNQLDLAIESLQSSS